MDMLLGYILYVIIFYAALSILVLVYKGFTGKIAPKPKKPRGGDPFFWWRIYGL